MDQDQLIASYRAALIDAEARGDLAGAGLLRYRLATLERKEQPSEPRSELVPA